MSQQQLLAIQALVGAVLLSVGGGILAGLLRGVGVGCATGVVIAGATLLGLAVIDRRNR